MTDIPAKPTNLYLTSNFVETTDNNGVYSRIACEGTWKDLFETTVAEKKKADRKKSSDFTIEWNGSRYRCNLADSYHGYGLTMRILPAGAPSFREDLKLDANIVLSLLKGTGLTLFAGQMGSVSPRRCLPLWSGWTRRSAARSAPLKTPSRAC